MIISARMIRFVPLMPIDGLEIADKAWYVYNANYGTSDEKVFVSMFAICFKHLQQTFENIYLIRNEREIKIVDE